ncbi:hypothetical protein P9112_000289 [Eukaryota sp. TZLM1-RC]
MDNDALTIGIDLGTTYSCASRYHSFNQSATHTAQLPDELQVAQDPSTGKHLTPSIVSWKASKKSPTFSTLVGESAENQLAQDPANTVYEIKRIIGKKYSDSSVQEDLKRWPFMIVKDPYQDSPLVQVNLPNPNTNPTPTTFCPEQISAEVLKKLKHTAEVRFNAKVSGAVNTVPYNFNETQRRNTRNAASLAGIRSVRLVNEPTAAILSYKFIHPSVNNKKILVFDLGGGTLDCTIAHLYHEDDTSCPVVKVLAVGGDARTGGMDIDNALVDMVIS